MAASDATPKTTYKRVMLKISGEALMGDKGFGLNPPTVERIAREVKSEKNVRRVYIWRKPIKIKGQEEVAPKKERLPTGGSLI